MILIANRWNPVSFECWESPGRGRFVLNIENMKGISPCINSVISPIHLVDLALASTHYISTGIKNGIDWRKSIALHRKLFFNGAPTGVIGALECFLIGAMCSRARLSNYGAAANCTHCGQLHSLVHLLWSCPHTLQLKDKYVTATNELAKLAEQDRSRMCFWTRGLIPLDCSKNIGYRQTFRCLPPHLLYHARAITIPT